MELELGSLLKCGSDALATMVDRGSSVRQIRLYSHAFTKLRIRLDRGRRHVDPVIPSIVLLLLLLMLATVTSMMTSTVDALETADDLQADEHKHAPSPAQHRDL